MKQRHMARIALIVLIGGSLATAAFWLIGLPNDEILFLLTGYGFAMLLILWLTPIAMAPGAIASLKVAMDRIRQGTEFDRTALRRASWAFRNNRDIRALATFDEPTQVPNELVQRIEHALPRLETSASRRLRIVIVAMIACMTIGAVCRFIGSIRHN